MKSIKIFLISTITSVIIIVVFASTIQSYQRSLQAFESISDKNLERLATTISDLTTNSSSEGFRENFDEYDIIYQVWSEEEQLISGYKLPDRNQPNFQNYTGYENFAHERWKTRMKFFPRLNIWVWLAEKQENKYSNVDDLIIHSLLPFIVAIPIIGFLSFFLITVGLAHIKELSAQISLKAENDLSPIELTNLPVELKILRDSTNSLFARLEVAFNTEKRLSSNAAHELRTPISGLKTYVEYLHSTRPNDLEIEKLLRISNRLTHITEQILTLNRLSPELFRRQSELINLEPLIQEVVASCYSAVLEKDQNIEVDSKRCFVFGNRFALYTMLTNIINNSNKYTQNKGRILIKMYTKLEQCIIEVHDNGPGIPSDFRERVVERFYRLDGDRNDSSTYGSGLGLSIVNDVIKSLDGKLEILNSRFNTGICISVSLKKSDNANEA